ncbi:MAG: DUF481 domain-containing protein [Pseudomonadota bacterium]
MKLSRTNLLNSMRPVRACRSIAPTAIAAAAMGTLVPAAALPTIQTNAPIQTDAVPAIARDIIDAAARNGDADDVVAVISAARDVLPSFAAAIDTYGNAVLADLNNPSNQDGVVAAAAASPEKTDADEAKVSSQSESDEANDAADEDADKDEVQKSYGLFALAPWEGSVNLAAVTASGNADNAAVGFALNASRITGKFTHNVAAYIDIGEANSVLSQKRWGASYKLDYAIAERWYAFGRIAYDEDEFSGFDYRVAANSGVGYFIAKSDPFTWKVEAGPGYRISLIDADDTRQNQFAFYAASDLDWAIREGLTLTSDIAATYTNATTTLEATHGLNATLWGSFTAGLSHYYRFETDPPADRVNSDNVIRATLGYKF